MLSKIEKCTRKFPIFTTLSQLLSQKVKFIVKSIEWARAWWANRIRWKDLMCSTCAKGCQMHAPVKRLAAPWCKWYDFVITVTWKTCTIILKANFIICEILCSYLRVLLNRHTISCCIHLIFVILYLQMCKWIEFEVSETQANAQRARLHSSQFCAQF